MPHVTRNALVVFHETFNLEDGSQPISEEFALEVHLFYGEGEYLIGCRARHLEVEPSPIQAILDVRHGIFR
jgi:hypothetical protein